MISKVLNRETYVVGYIEWEIVDERGQWTDTGSYIYIQDIWIHYKYRHSKTMKVLIELVKTHKLTQHTTHVYWCRHKYNHRMKLFKKERF